MKPTTEAGLAIWDKLKVKPPVPMTDAGLAAWAKLTEEQQIAATRRHLHTQILASAARLRTVSGAAEGVASQANYLIEVGVARLLGSRSVKDETLRGAVQVLTGSQPGRGGAASKYRRIGELVKRWAAYQFPPPEAPCDPPDADRWAEGAELMACALDSIDPRFKSLDGHTVASILAGYRSTRSKQGLTDAVTALCVASKALGTSRRVDAEGPAGVEERRKLRERVAIALRRKT